MDVFMATFILDYFLSNVILLLIKVSLKILQKVGYLKKSLKMLLYGLKRCLLFCLLLIMIYCLSCDAYRVPTLCRLYLIASEITIQSFNKPSITRIAICYGWTYPNYIKASLLRISNLLFLEAYSCSTHIIIQHVSLLYHE